MRFVRMRYKIFEFFRILLWLAIRLHQEFEPLPRASYASPGLDTTILMRLKDVRPRTSHNVATTSN